MRVVYALLDPRDGTIRYVGVSTNVQGRVQFHRNGGGAKDNPAKVAWVGELRVLGLEPEYLQLEECSDSEEAFRAEKRWIDFCLAEEEPLLNITYVKNRRGAGRKHTQAEVDAIVAEYQRTGKRPAGWCRQTWWHVRKTRGLL